MLRTRALSVDFFREGEVMDAIAKKSALRMIPYGLYVLTGATDAPVPGADPGLSILVLFVVQSLLGAATVTVLGRIGARLLSPREGILASALLALYGPALFYDAALLTPSLLLFLTTALVLLVDSGGFNLPFACRKQQSSES